ncbi:DUF4032 domain-containing protein, partial [Nocardioides sp. Leaf374]|uniref:DUF4032 domain-containing protein n=1 Tax=Nocardioides sp. Leaf374 TaxID=2876560 RepID=UPI002B4B9CDC
MVEAEAVRRAVPGAVGAHSATPSSRSAAPRASTSVGEARSAPVSQRRAPASPSRPTSAAASAVVSASTTSPREARGKLEPAEVFHEILEHRWYLSEQA